ncbi:MAG: hypothetical protein H8E72_00335 [Candidatus Marinimicrobia bacterium]|nr:hypothetical protein [Candidatus Neomarinimicrobiota bacterium]
MLHFTFTLFNIRVLDLVVKFIILLTIFSLGLNSNVVGLQSLINKGCPILKEVKCPFSQKDFSKTTCHKNSQKKDCPKKNLHRISKNIIEIENYTQLAILIEIPIKKYIRKFQSFDYTLKNDYLGNDPPGLLPLLI